MRNFVSLLLRQFKTKRKFKIISIALAITVLFATTYALIIPAITWSCALVCELEEHSHSDGCYENGLLVCKIPEHTHSDSCYDATPMKKSLSAVKSWAPPKNEPDSGAYEINGSDTAHSLARLSNGGVFVLTADLTATSTVNITKDTVLDLNGFNIRVSCDPLFNITSGNLTIKNSGEIQYTTSISGDVSTDSNIATYSKGTPLTLKNYKLTNPTKFSAWGDGAVANLFDNNSATKIGGSVSGGVLSIEFETDTMQKVSEYSLTSASDTASYSSRSPKSWVLYGESDGKWVSLSSVTNVPVDSGVEHRYSISNPNQYQRYKIEFQTNSSFQMADIKLYTDNQEKLTFYTTET